MADLRLWIQLDFIMGTAQFIHYQLFVFSCDLVWDTLWQSLLSKQWLASQKNRCHLVRGTYLRVIMEMRLKAHQELPGELRGMLLEETMKIMRCEQVQVIHVSLKPGRLRNIVWKLLELLDGYPIM